MRTLALALLTIALAGGVFAACSTPQQQNSPSATHTATATPTITPTPTATLVPTPTPTLTATPTPSANPTSTATPSATPTSAPTAPKIVDYRVIWTEVKDFDPSTIPVEEGFYSGESLYSLYYGTNMGDLGPIPIRYAYAWKILPHLEGLPVAVAAARDKTNKDIILVALEADRYGAYILLSGDGEKSWCKLNLLLGGVPHGDATSVRVTLTGDEVHLYGKDARPGNHWWTATVNKSELPCS